MESVSVSASPSPVSTTSVFTAEAKIRLNAITTTPTIATVIAAQNHPERRCRAGYGALYPDPAT